LALGADRVTREEDALNLHTLRIVLQQAGLIRKYKGAFRITKKGTSMLADAKAGELYALLFLTFFGKFKLSYLDHMPEYLLVQDTIGFSFYMIGTHAERWRDLDSLAERLLPPFVKEEINKEGFPQHAKWVADSRILVPLERFGLLEFHYEDDPALFGPRRDKVRKTPLFESFFAFNASDLNSERTDDVTPSNEKMTEETARKKAQRKTEVYEIKITLEDIKPAVSRRFAVPGKMTLGRLHEVIQVVMGWTNSHLHEFKIKGRCYGMIDDDMDWGSSKKTFDEWGTTLCDVVSDPDTKFTYMYDFGDGWQHRCKVMKIGPPEKNRHYPVCLAGKRACPPEDCGGPWGYASMLEAIADPEDENHEEMIDWIGGSFDPEAFDLEQVNKILKSI